jgi:dienelactone hydrolase
VVHGELEGKTGMMSTAIYTRHGKSLSAEFHAPAGPARGLIVIAPGAEEGAAGPNGRRGGLIGACAEAFARKGFGVLIPDYLAVTGTSPGPEASELIPSHRDFWEEALSDAIDHGQALPGMAGTPVGLLGFSLGGHLCLRLRRKAGALACFLTPLLDGLGAPGKLRNVQIHYGQTGNPSEAGYRDAKTIARLLEAEGTAAELCGYFGTESGFGGAEADTACLHGIARARTLAFFDACLGFGTSVSHVLSHPASATRRDFG